MSEALMAYGIYGTFSELCLMRGEDTALIFGNEPIFTNANESGEEEEEDEEEEEEETISYLQLQFAATALAAVLYHRFGVRKGDRVLLWCGGIAHAGAEITSLLACLRLQCLFVPLVDLGSLQEIVADSQPTAGIVVGNSDEDEAVLQFAHAGLYRVALVHSTGELVLAEASESDIREDLPPIVLPPPPPSACDEEEANEGEAAAAAAAAAESDDALYLLYTSGSTGVPKGVVGKHSALVNRLCWQFDQFPFEFGEVCCRRTPLHFVDSMAEIFAPLLSGVPIFVPPMSQFMQGGISAIATSAQAQGVSRMTLLPSQLSQALMTNRAVMEAWKDLRIVVVSGEACPSSLVTRFAAHMPHATLVNLFGSTEIAGDVAFAVLHSSSIPCCKAYKWPQTCMESIDGEDKGDWLVPIGHAITNNSLLVVTEASGGVPNGGEGKRTFDIMPDGIEGELLVSGRHLAAGYFQRQEETASRFISPLLRGCIDERKQEEEIYFRTGDMVVRCATNGALHWLGRRDLQYKVRGVRVELEGAERAVCKALSSTPFGDESKIAMIAVDLEQQQQGAAESTVQLILFVETNAVKEIRDLLSSSPGFSPLFMPTLILPVEKVPRNKTGKVDRHQLRDTFETIVVDRQAQSLLSSSSSSSSKRASQSSASMGNDVEENLYIITKQVLPLMDLLPRDQESFSFTDKDTFFSLGGDSMSAVEFLWRMKQNFPFTMLTMRELHETSMPRLVAKIRQQEALVVVETSERERKVPRLLEDEKQQQEDPKESTQGNKQLLSPLLLPHDGKTILAGRGGFSSTFPSHSHDSLLLISELSQLLNPTSSSSSSSATFDSAVPTTMTERWSVQMERCVDASPLLVATSLSLASPLTSAHIYVGAHSGQFCKVDVVTGVSVWTLQLGGHIEGAAVCTRDGAMIFVASFKSIDIHGIGGAASGGEVANVGSIWAISSEGHIAWTRSLPCEVKGAATVDEERSLLFVGCHDACVHIFGLADGIETNVLECNGSVFASPLLLPCGGVVVAATSGIVSCYSGTEFAVSWTYNVDAPIFSSLIYTTNMVLFGAVDGTLRSISSENGQELWVAPWATRPVFSTPCFTHEQTRVLYGSHDGFLRSVSLLDGSLLWDCYMGAVVFAAPTVFADASSSRMAVVATTAGEVLLVDIRDKGAAKEQVEEEEEVSVENQQWRIVTRIKLAGEIYSSPVVCSLASPIFIGARDDKLHCLSALF